jgi:hypothetical protein
VLIALMTAPATSAITSSDMTMTLKASITALGPQLGFLALEVVSAHTPYDELPMQCCYYVLMLTHTLFICWDDDDPMLCFNTLWSKLNLACTILLADAQSKVLTTFCFPSQEV